MTLSEKVTFLELHQQSPLASFCTDKYAVRAYVKEKGLEEILIPLAGGPWTEIERMDFSALPVNFALKATHGCKMNYIVADKSKLDVEDCRKEMRRWLDTTYGGYSMEPHYLSIPHRIYAEEYLEDADKLVDYKFHCMNGIPQFVLVCSDRKANGDKAMGVTLDLFDMDWNPLPGLIAKGAEIPGDGTVAKPNSFDKMTKIAKSLSEDFDFVRVDLYETNGTILFGELTFTPANCVFPYFTKEFDTEMGKKLILSDKRMKAI